jgi:tRNA(fMet)-specific endonuclease VapC
MKYLLDTNICVCWLKGNEQIEQKILSVGMDNVALSFINVSELYYGAYKSQRIESNLNLVRQLTGQLDVVESDEAISEIFGQLKAELESSRTPLAGMASRMAGIGSGMRSTRRLHGSGVMKTLLLGGNDVAHHGKVT